MKKAIILVLSAFALVKLVVMAVKFHLPDWDESVYLAMSRYIYSGGQFGLFENIRPIGLPMLIPFGSIVFADILMLGFSLGLIYLTYLIARELFSEKIGLLAAVLTAVTPLFFYYSLKIYTGIPTAFFMLLAVYLFLKNRWYLCGLFAGIAFWFRFPAGILIVALLAAAWPKHKKIIPLAQISIVFFSVVALFLIFAQVVYGNAAGVLLSASTHQFNQFFVVDGFTQNMFYYVFVLMYPNLILLSVFVSLVLYYKKMNVVYFAFLLLFVYFTIISNKQPRFAIMMLPFAAILASHGLEALYKRIRNIRIARYALILFVTVIMVIMSVHNGTNAMALPASEPQIVKDYLLYDFKGTVMTTDPLPAVYSDAKFVPAYNSVFEAETILNQQSFDMVIFFPAVLPCWTEKCRESLENIRTIFDEEYVLVEQTDQGDYSRSIFKRKLYNELVIFSS